MLILRWIPPSGGISPNKRNKRYVCCNDLKISTRYLWGKGFRKNSFYTIMMVNFHLRISIRLEKVIMQDFWLRSQNTNIHMFLFDIFCIYMCDRSQVALTEFVKTTSIDETVKGSFLFCFPKAWLLLTNISNLILLNNIL